MRVAFTALSLSFVLLCGTNLHATPVAPGGSATFDFNSPAFVAPTGDLLASDSRTLTLNYTPPTGLTFDPGQPTSKDVTFTSEVRRDPVSGVLSFLYQLDPVSQGHTGAEGATATYTSFGTFSTDITGDAKGNTLTVTRSADGATLTANGGSQGIGSVPTFAVATDAKDFDKNGSMTLELIDEFSFTDHGNDNAIASTTITGTLEPITAAPPPPQTGIPLPPAAWTGLAMLALLAGATKLGMLRRGIC